MKGEARKMQGGIGRGKVKQPKQGEEERDREMQGRNKVGANTIKNQKRDTEAARKGKKRKGQRIPTTKDKEG